VVLDAGLREHAEHEGEDVAPLALGIGQPQLSARGPVADGGDVVAAVGVERALHVGRDLRAGAVELAAEGGEETAQHAAMAAFETTLAAQDGVEVALEARERIFPWREDRVEQRLAL